MKSVNDLVRGEYQDFEGIKSTLNVFDVRVELLEKAKREYEENREIDGKLPLKTLERVYKRLEKLSDVEAQSLCLELFTTFPALGDYLDVKKRLQEVKTCRSEFLELGLHFNEFNEDAYCDHQLMVNEGELECVFCNASTKGLDLSDEDKNIIIRFAQKQGCFIDGATKEDLAFIEVLKERIAEIRKRRQNGFRAHNKDEAAYLDLVEELYLSEEADINRMKIAVKQAHMRDNEVLVDGDYRLTSLAYLSSDKAKHMLYEIEREMEKLVSSDSRFKKLMLESLLTARYEVLILSGNSVPTLLEGISSDDELVALVKAYYNLFNQDYRINSGYFANEVDALAYTCFTANPVINNKILEMKLRR